MRTDTGQPVLLADYRAPDYLIDEVALDFSLAENETRVRAKLSVRPNPRGRAGAPLALDGDELVCVSARLDNTGIDLAGGMAGPQGFTLENPPQRPFTLEIETALDPARNTKLMGLYKSGGAFCTQCEAEGFRRITYFLDRPDVLSTYTVRIEADRKTAPVLLGNGNPEQSGAVAGTDRHFAVWRDPHPKPCYLFALVAGDLGHISDQFMTMSGRKVTLGVYVEHGKEARALYAMDALKRSMRWDEKVFGREYDLDVFNIVAVADFNMGAMENKGLNVFNDKLVLASPETATDADYASIEAVIAHEYFHNWTGNRITCRDWFQLCLKEGLTVYRDQEFSADERSRAVKRIADARNLRTIQFAEDASPLAHNVRPVSYKEINNFYTATVYEKGAELIRMLKLLTGAEAFAKGMDLYFTRCDGTAATMEDFLACFAECSGADLTQFMLWYEQAGTPELYAAQTYDKAAGTLTLTLRQSTKPTPGQPVKKPFVIPVALALLSRKGEALPLKAHGDASDAECERGLFLLSAEARDLTFGGVSAPPVVSLLRGFSAPVALAAETSDADLTVLLAHDSDPFNRWQAGQTLASRALMGALAAPGNPRHAHIFEGFRAAAGRLLNEACAPSSQSDLAFAAQVLALPGEADLAREIGVNVDPDAIFSVRRDFVRRLGDALSADFSHAYGHLGNDGPYSPDAAAAGRRALRNSALMYLSAASAADSRAEKQFGAARNMTDRLAALYALALHGGARREAALEAFHKAHSDDPLIVDKWLTLQAAIPEAGTLARVRALMIHPAFSISNPNRVRALIGAFAGQNPTQFHRPDGAGYAFVREAVLELDPRNPQVASRLLGAFRTWRMMEPSRQARAKRELEMIAGAPKLSRDVHEIAERLLG